MIITAYVNGVEYPRLEHDFVNANLENAVDVVTLDNSMYTDFVDNTHNQWSLQWAYLTEDQYNAIRADYDAQFTDYQYPTLSIPYYSVVDVPCRMYINEKNIWNYCGEIKGVEVIFRETSQLPEGS